MRCLVLVLLLGGCAKEGAAPVARVRPRALDNLSRVYDAEFGVACYWLTTQSFSCVKADPVDGGAR